VGRLRGVDGTVDRRPAERRTRPSQPATQGVDVRFEGADHGPYHLQAILPETNQNDLTFVRALPLAEAADPSSAILIAYQMNGEPLTPDHGAPFRLIVPHWYAVASVKWLRRIDVLTDLYTGEFQTGHYIYQWPDRPHEAVRLMRVRARITDPAPGAILPLGPYTVRGKAWSGTGPVTQVDISLTGEGDWHPARLDPPKGPYQWQDWSFVWDSNDVRRHTLRARATDAAGNVQPDVPPWNRLGYGNNAIEVLFVDRH
jgi:DMSO/TMAO reductase YedYZ molybdopterin-dependent catalytic subunit